METGELTTERPAGEPPRPTDPRPPGPSEHRDVTGAILAQSGRFGVVGLAIALIVLFSLLTPSSFATVDNYRAILENETVVVVLALAVLVPLIVGEFDLSVAAVLSMTQVLSVGLVAEHGFSPALAIVVAVLSGTAFGVLNAVLVVRLQVLSIVATLATASLASGVGIWYTNGETIFSNVPHAFTAVSRARLAGVPITVVYIAVIAAVMWFVFTWLPVGRRLYATGGNRRAAALTGIATTRYVSGVFVCSAFLASLAGVMLGTRLGSASATTGSELLLPAIAGAFLGATTIRPGQFNVLGTVVAVYALSIAIAGLQQVGAPAWVEPVFNGGVLATAVALSGWAVRSREKRARTRQLTLLERGEPGGTG